MKGISYWFVVALQIMSWVSASSRHFPSINDLEHVHEAGSSRQNPHQYPQVTFEQELASSNDKETKMNEIAELGGGSKIGSSPPSCENKCCGCNPCVAIQVPTTTKKLNHFRVEYANYEPEGWKCKCGPSLYSP